MLNKGLLNALMLICFLGVLSVSCNKDDDSFKINYDNTYEFEVIFKGSWFKEDFGTSFPKEGASFGNFVGMTHKRKDDFYKLGEKASQGLAKYAETGDTLALINEIQERINANTSSVKIVGSKVEPTGEVSVTFRTTLRYKYVSLISKVNPGPDWFVAVENIDLTLIPNKSTIITKVFLANDAGIKDGLSFNDFGSDTENGVITRLSSGDLSLGGVIPSLGHITIVNNGVVEEDED